MFLLCNQHRHRPHRPRLRCDLRLLRRHRRRLRKLLMRRYNCWLCLRRLRRR
jgi:hypothetical protein